MLQNTSVSLGSREPDCWGPVTKPCSGVVHPNRKGNEASLGLEMQRNGIQLSFRLSAIAAQGSEKAVGVGVCMSGVRSRLHLKNRD